MSRDCTDQVTGKELVQISVELVEKAEILESYFSIAEPSGSADELLSSDISVSDDDKSS